MKKYNIEGTDRIVGAIGAFEKFSEPVTAESLSEAIEKARKQRYEKGREHVHVSVKYYPLQQPSSKKTN